jgi:type IV pilus assembly protein PilM
MFGIFGGGSDFGLEIGHNVLRAAVVGGKAGSRHVVQLENTSLAAGTMAESFTNPNIIDVQAFTDAVRKLSGRIGRAGRRVNVALPDYAGRVVMLDFEALPKKADEASNMIKWRLRKLMPFDIEQAVIRHQYLGEFREKDGSRHRYVTAVIKSDIVEQYEKTLGDAGFRPGRMDLASFCVWNLYSDYVTREVSGRSFCILNVCCSKITVMVFEGGVIRFFRLKDLGLSGESCATSEAGSATLVRELRTSLTYYAEHVSGNNRVGLVYLSGELGEADRAVSDITSGLGLEAKALCLDMVIQEGPVSRRLVDKVQYGAACGAALER